jgi:hypothetical protein
MKKFDFKIIENKKLKFILLFITFLLLIPLIAMQFTNEVNWTLCDFVVAGILLFGTGIIFNLVVRKIKNIKYRIVIGVALLIVLLLIWAELAVGILDTPLSGI